MPRERTSMFGWVVGSTVAFVLWAIYGWTFVKVIVLIFLICFWLAYRMIRMKPNAVESPRGTTSAAVPSGTMAEVVSSETSHFAVPPFDNQAPSALDVQADVVIGKGRKTLALIRSVSYFYEVDEHHPQAITDSEQMRKFLRQFQDEWDGLVRLRSDNPESLGNEDVQKLGEAADLKKQIDSKLKQLQAMGFSD